MSLKTAIIVPALKVCCVHVALNPILMKCFEKLVLMHIKDNIPASLDPHQYLLRFPHTENKDSYIRMLYVYFSSALITISPMTLIGKRSALDFITTFCNWLLNFLTSRPQRPWIGSNASSTIRLVHIEQSTIQCLQNQGDDC